MDNKTWRQVNFGGSTITIRGHHQPQHLAATTGSGYPVVSTNHWQRMNFSNGSNVLPNSSSITNQQQFNQIQQLPLRYFQIRKSTSAQYANQIASMSPNQRYQTGNPSASQHFPHNYAVLAESSSSYPQNPERSRFRPNFQGTSSLGPYIQTVRKSPNPTSKSPENIQTHHHNNADRSIIPDADNGRDQRKNFENPTSTIRQTAKYEILANGHFFIPTNERVSLSETEISGFSSSSRSSIDHVTSRIRKITAIHEACPTPPFVNAFDAVPDMLSEVRPGTTSFYTIDCRKSRFLISESEFSYHAVKPQREMENQSLPIDIDDKKNGPDSIVTNQRSYLSIVERKNDDKNVVEPRKKLITKKIVTLEVIRDREKSKDAERIICNSQKTYADAVQLTTKHEISFNSRINENSRRYAQSCKTPFCGSPLNKMAARGGRKKREYEFSDDDNENCTKTLSLRDRSLNGSSSSRILDTFDDKTASRELNDKRARSPSRKRLCKMAEMFCLRELENTKFNRSFDDHNRRRRRMTYTGSLEDENESTIASHQKESCRKMSAEVTLLAELSLDRKTDLFSDNSSSRSRNSMICSNDFIGDEIYNSPTIAEYRFNDIVADNGVFKVLQKLKECADGNGAIYTNSWRPDEIHFLRRYHRDKYA